MPDGGLIELRVLGGTALAGGVEQRMHELLRRPKKLALLTYLLVARPRGFHRREGLLELFWPEQTAERARHCLRQALHELRNDLGPIIDTRGTDEIAVSRDRVWCDAVVFDDAISESDLARAVTLCRGELLDGIIIQGASPLLLDWLKRERARYREDAARAACGLAERAAAEGNTNSAVRWGRLAATLAPLDEIVLWRLLQLYRDLGYHAGAEQLYRLFVQRLQTELAIEPSARTRSLMDEIRGPNP